LKKISFAKLLVLAGLLGAYAPAVLADESSGLFIGANYKF
jgi:hypothetical protein